MLLNFNAYTNSEKTMISTIRSYNWAKHAKLWLQIKMETHRDGVLVKL